MKVMQTSISGVIKIQPTVHLDPRGYFFESFKSSDFQAFGLPSRAFLEDCTTN